MFTNRYNRTKTTKIITGKSFQTLLPNYNRTHSQQRLQTIIGEIIQKMLTNHYHKNDFKNYLQTIIRQIIPHNAHRLLTGNLSQTLVTNYRIMNHSKHNTYKLLSQKSFQCLQIIERETIPNNASKFLSEKQFQTMTTNFYKKSHSK